MNKHTPGPWRVGDAGATIFGPKQEPLPPRIIANVSRLPVVPGEPLANARLIAAAPDLLAALEALADREPCRFDHHGNCQTHRLGNPCENAVALAAIAKARGE